MKEKENFGKALPDVRPTPINKMSPEPLGSAGTESKTTKPQGSPRMFAIVSK